PLAETFRQRHISRTGYSLRQRWITVYRSMTPWQSTLPRLLKNRVPWSLGPARACGGQSPHPADFPFLGRLSPSPVVLPEPSGLASSGPLQSLGQFGGNWSLNDEPVQRLPA